MHELNCRVECKGPKTARALGPGLLILWLGSLTSPAAARAGLESACASLTVSTNFPHSAIQFEHYLTGEPAQPRMSSGSYASTDASSRSVDTGTSSHQSVNNTGGAAGELARSDRGGEGGASSRSTQSLTNSERQAADAADKQRANAEHRKATVLAGQLREAATLDFSGWNTKVGEQIRVTANAAAAVSSYRSTKSSIVLGKANFFLDDDD